MRAAWYDEQGAAEDVLHVGEQPTPEPTAGEVRVRVAFSGVHLGDIGKRRGYWGSTMPFPRVIPHGDGAGVIDAVGSGVSADRIGERVWVYLAQSYRPRGTAAEFVVVPAAHAVKLPESVPFEAAAGLGIPGITGHRAIHAAGELAGKNVLVTGATGAVGRAAVAAARRSGATVIGSARRAEELDAVRALPVHHAVLGGPGMADRITDIIGSEQLDLAADVAFDANIDELLPALRYNGAISTYATGDGTPSIPYWPLGFKNITIRFLSNDDFPEAANQDAARDLTSMLTNGSLHYPVRAIYPLEAIAAAHDDVEHGHGNERVLVHVQDIDTSSTQEH